MPDFSIAALRQAAKEALDVDPEAVSAAPAAPVDAPSHTPMHLALAAMGAGQAADALSTISALKRSGTAEGNPIYGKHPSAARILGTKAAIAAPVGYLLDRAYDKHPKLAAGASLAFGGLGLALAAHNSKQGR